MGRASRRRIERHFEREMHSTGWAPISASGTYNVEIEYLTLLDAWALGLVEFRKEHRRVWARAEQMTPDALREIQKAIEAHIRLVIPNNKSPGISIPRRLIIVDELDRFNAAISSIGKK